jgi:AcrR family transcriptional regulator
MSTESRESGARRLRAERILDVTRDLILRWGLKRVSIDEVAEHAEVGKGTIYLHWRSREELFLAVLGRSAVGILQQLVDGIEADPRQALPHNHVRNLFLLVHGEPLIQAVVAEDREILGRLVDKDRAAQFRDRFTTPRSPAEAAPGSVLRPGLPAADADFITGSILAGFFHSSAKTPSEGLQYSLEETADLLADAVERAVENPDPASNEAVYRFAEATLEPLLQLRTIAGASLGGTPPPSAFPSH